MKFTIIKSCLARFSGIFAVGTPSNIHGTAISYRCAKFGAFVNSVTILTLRDLTISGFCDRASELCSFNKLKLVKPLSEVLKITDKKQIIINSACSELISG